MEGADSLPFIILRFKIRTKIFVFELERGPEYYTMEIHVYYLYILILFFVAMDAFSKPDYLLLTMATHALRFSISCFVL